MSICVYWYRNIILVSFLAGCSQATFNKQVIDIVPSSQNPSPNQTRFSPLGSPSKSPLPVPQISVAPPLVVLPSSKPENLIQIPRALQVEVRERLSRSIELRWFAFETGTHYQVRVDGKLINSNLTESKYRITDLNPYTQHFIQISAWKGTELLSAQELSVWTLVENYSGGGGGGSFYPPVDIRETDAPPIELTLKYVSEQQGQIHHSQLPALDSDRERLIVTLFPAWLRSLSLNHELIWDAELNDLASSSPLVDAWGNIYIGLVNGKLQSFSSDGSVNWLMDLGEESLVGMALDQDINFLYVTTRAGKIYCVDIMNQNIVWEHSLDFKLAGPPVITSDRLVLVGGGGTTWYALKGNDGAIAWRLTGAGDIGNQSAVPVPSRIYMAYKADGLYALTPEGLVNWHFTGVTGLKSPPVIDSYSQSYFIGTDNFLYALDFAGDLRWRLSLEIPIRTGELTVDQQGNVYVLGDNDLLVVSNQGRLIARQALNEQMLGGATLDTRGQLHVMGISGRLRTFDAFAPMAEWFWPKSMGHPGNTGKQREWIP